MNWRLKWQQLKTGLKIAFKRADYINYTERKAELIKKEETLKNKEKQLQNRIPGIKAYYTHKFQELYNEAYQKGYSDGQIEYSHYLNRLFSPEPEDNDNKNACFVEDLYFKKQEFEELERLLKKNDFEVQDLSDDPLMKKALKNVFNILRPNLEQIQDYVKGLGRETVIKALSGACEGLKNYVQFTFGLNSFENIALIDSSYIERWTEYNPVKRISLPALLPEGVQANWIGMPITVLKEIHKKTADTRIKRQQVNKIKRTIADLVKNNNLILIPKLDDSTLDLSTKLKFSKLDDENNQLKIEEGDVQIIKFVETYCKCLINPIILVNDFKLSRVLQQYLGNTVQIISPPGPGKWRESDYYYETEVKEKQ